MTIYDFPYSEHSSFSELREFVRVMNPVRVTPSVGNDRDVAEARMLKLLKG